MIGATGLIGRSLAPLLVAAGHDLLIVGRRPSGVAGARDAVGPVAQWPELLEGETVEVAISTLGTTRKAAGSMEAFEAIDRHAVIAFARAAREAGARQWMMVSSVGADAGSGNGYLAVKGRAEADARAIGFARMDVVQPGLLLGARDEVRPAERLGAVLSPLINRLIPRSLDRYRAIAAADVAAAMAALAGAAGSGEHVHQNRAIHALANGAPRPIV